MASGLKLLHYELRLEEDEAKALERLLSSVDLADIEKLDLPDTDYDTLLDILQVLREVL